MEPGGVQLPSGKGGGEGFGERVRHRPISLEEIIREQIHDIARLRSWGYPWAEAVFTLRDLVVGLEDEQFWDGIPPSARSRLKAARAAGDVEEVERIREAYGRYGWDSCPVRAFEAGDGSVVYRPSPEDLSALLRIILRLLARRGVNWKRKRQTRFSPWGESVEGEGGEGHGG